MPAASGSCTGTGARRSTWTVSANTNTLTHARTRARARACIMIILFILFRYYYYYYFVFFIPSRHLWMCAMVNSLSMLRMICIWMCAVVDTPSMLRIIYELAIPDGQFQPAKYNPWPRAKQDPAQMLVSLEKVGRRRARGRGVNEIFSPYDIFSLSLSASAHGFCFARLFLKGLCLLFQVNGLRALLLWNKHTGHGARKGPEFGN